MALSAPGLNEKKRVKVYELRENDWFDRGTGFCAVQTINDEGRIYVEAEEEPDTSLLEVRIKKDDNYQKQQETLIVWTDAEGVDMALSFQEAEGCGMVWTTIAEVQHRLPDGPEDGFFAHMILPPPELRNLPEIENVVRGASSTQQGRDALTKLILTENYIAALIPLLETAEDLEDIQDLHRLSNIIKTLILFNESQIIEYIVRDEIIIGVVGALEYDPEFPNHKANHRQYLTDESVFKEVVKIEDEEIQKKIHFTYRLQYLKDVVLARILDDPTFSVLNSLIFFNQIEIVSHVTTNMTFLKELFGLVASDDTPPEKRKDAVLFIQQSCSIAKTLQAQARGALYNNLISCGLFATITYALQHQDAAVRVAGTDILVAIIEHDALMMRNYIYKSISEKSKPMTDTLIELLLIETDLGVKAQIADAIKILLEPAGGASGQGPDKSPSGDSLFVARTKNQPSSSPQSEGFLQNFFDLSAKKLFQPLKDLETRKSPGEFSIHEISLYSHLIEILCFFLRQPSYRSKYFILSEGLATRVAQLMRCSEKHLKLTAIKYFRTCIGLQDEFYTRQLISNRLFEPLLGIIYETMPRDNLLNSACLELFDFILRESIKPIILHLVETYRERLEGITFVDLFSRIVLRYDQIMDPGSAPAHASMSGDVPTEPNSSFMTSDAETTPNSQQRHIMINGGGTRWQGLKGPDAAEDAYFNTSDDDEDDDDDDDDDDDTGLSNDNPNVPHPRGSLLPNGGGGGGGATKPLVDYDDDDDDDDDATKVNKEIDTHKRRRMLGTLPSTSSAPSTSPSASASNNLPTEPAAAAVPEEIMLSVDDDEQRHDKSSSGSSSHNDNAKSSSQSSSTTFSLGAAAAVEPPKMSLAEKRRREEDDDDDDDALGKLSSKSGGASNSAKRRNSAASTSSIFISGTGSDGGSGGVAIPVDQLGGGGGISSKTSGSSLSSSSSSALTGSGSGSATTAGQEQPPAKKIQKKDKDDDTAAAASSSSSQRLQSLRKRAGAMSSASSSSSSSSPAHSAAPGAGAGSGEQNSKSASSLPPSSSSSSTATTTLASSPSAAASDSIAAASTTTAAADDSGDGGSGSGSGAGNGDAAAAARQEKEKDKDKDKEKEKSKKKVSITVNAIHARNMNTNTHTNTHSSRAAAAAKKDRDRDRDEETSSAADANANANDTSTTTTGADTSTPVSTNTSSSPSPSPTPAPTSTWTASSSSSSSSTDQG